MGQCGYYPCRDGEDQWAQRSGDTARSMLQRQTSLKLAATREQRIARRLKNRVRP